MQQVVGPNSTVIHLSYDDADRVVRAEDSDKNWTTYKYNSKGFLTDVVHSSGSARYYFYEDDLLTYM